MLQQRELLENKILFRVLETRGLDISDICKKLINLLSEDELCQLWCPIKRILLDAQNICHKKHCDDTCTQGHKTLHQILNVIISLALETIQQRIFVPNVLLEIVIILHSTTLTKIADIKVKDKISYLLEQWWILDMIWKEKVIINAVKYLIGRSGTSLKHIKRLYNIRTAVCLLKEEEEIQELLIFAQKKPVLSLLEGKELLSFLLSLGEKWIMGIYGNIKVLLEKTDSFTVLAYADIYASAILSADKINKKLITNKCLGNIVFHCLRAERGSSKSDKLRENLQIFLNYLYNHRQLAIRKLMHEKFDTMLWDHLKAPGSCVRCNAAEFLFMSCYFPDKCVLKGRKNSLFIKHYNAVTDLLNDPNHEVCLASINGSCKIMEKNWSFIPNSIKEKWFHTFLNYTKSSNSSEIRAAVFYGLKHVLTNGNTREIIKEILPHYCNSIYDTNEMVVEAFVKLLFYAHTNVGILFWDIIPVDSVLEKLEVTDSKSLSQNLIKLLRLRIFSKESNMYEAINDLLNIGLTNINGVRKVFLYSKDVIDWNTSLKFMNSMLLVLEKKANVVPPRNECKRRRISNFQREEICLLEEKAIISNTQSVHILIDLISILLVISKDSARLENCKEGEKDLISMIMNILPKLLTNFKNRQIRESVIFLFSLVPLEFMTNEKQYIEIFLKELCETSVSSDMILTIITVLIKWGAMDLLFVSLTDHIDEAVINYSECQKEKSTGLKYIKDEKSLELSLRIFKHLLHMEFRSVLMIKYYHCLLHFWEKLSISKCLVVQKIHSIETDNNFTSVEITLDIFREYVNMISILQKTDEDLSFVEHYEDVMDWAKRELVPNALKSQENNGNDFSVEILRIILNALKLTVLKCQTTTKLCCKIVLFYCDCLVLSNGIIFVDDAFNLINNLLDYGKTAYNYKNSDILNVIVPKVLSAVMITLSKYSENIINQSTNNLKNFSPIIVKCLITAERISKQSELKSMFMAIALNTAVSCISKELKNFFSSTINQKISVLDIKLPYLSGKILSIILHTKKYKLLCIHVMKIAMSKYTKFDAVSGLIILYKILKLPAKPDTKLYKEIIETFQVKHCQTVSTEVDRMISDVVKNLLSYV
ncbi:condensin-2 complex subunit G2-like isoform X2 [Prorops nasuta]|uniref:condensin-2 complex subunit G2-like isoform X2 n=1 Tax=Prorops nasuta TaxID=863751 RepID=UPI0034CD96B9